MLKCLFCFSFAHNDLKRALLILILLAGFTGVTRAEFAGTAPGSVVIANTGPGFTIYPNPVNGSSFDINFKFNETEFPNVHLSIVNVLGQNVYSYNLVKMDYSNGKVHIDISDRHLTTGIYFVQLTSGENTKTVRLAIR